MAYTARLNLPLVMTPSDHVWGFHEARFALAESFLKKPMPTKEDPGPLLMRYFAAFGPASVTDAQTWSGLKGVRAIVEALRPKLETFRDERGRELFDIQGAPHPPEDTPAPLRFLPDFDNLLLAYSDRERIIAEAHKPAVFRANLGVEPAILVDGFAAGTWKIERRAKRATLMVAPFGKFTKRTRQEVEEEGGRLVRFVEPQASAHEIRFGA